MLSVPAYDVPITFTTSPKYILGWVRTTEPISRPVSAHVEAHRVDRLGYNETDTNPATGNYTLALAPGLWEVKVSPVSGTTPSWVYPYEARSVSFVNDLAPEFKMMNFGVVVADSPVQGAVELPPPGSGVAPPFTVTVSLHNDDGIGLDQDIDSNGHFSFTVPHGGYKLNFKVASGLFAAPEKDRWVYANPITPTNLHTITLRARDAYLIGSLTDNHGDPAPDVPVVAWNPKTHATFESRSNSNGVYVTAIYSGTWLVRPAPQPAQPYVYTGTEQTVAIATGQTYHQPFTLLDADATIHGILQDENGNPVTTARGWASARDEAGVRTGAPVAAGEFNILVPGGTYTVALNLPNGQLYMAGSPQSVSVSSGETQTVTFTLIKKTALIFGALLNRRDVSPVADADGKVWAWSSEAEPGTDLWTGTAVKPDGLYALPVPAGVWQVNYAIDPNSGFMKAEGPRWYAVQDKQTQRVDLPVVRKDSRLNGYVTLPDGTPVTGTVVVAEGISKELEDVTVRAPVDQNGYYTMTLPFGLYNVHATPLPGYINPRMKAVYVPLRATVNASLQYRQADAWITGVVTLTNAPITPTGRVSLWAWTADDGYSETRVRVGGTYSLPVTSGESWKLAATYELGSYYWMTRTVVSIPAAGAVNQDLKLSGPRIKPAPLSVVFDASQDQSIELTDGTRIYIPGGAMPVDGRVVLHITPLAAAPHHRNGDVLGIHYAFEAFTEDGQPITQDFNQDVAITLRYDPADVLALGLGLHHLRPAYFSTTSNSWILPDSYVVDEARHEITLQINHFTEFGIVNAEGVSAVYLPIVIR